MTFNIHIHIHDHRDRREHRPHPAAYVRFVVAGRFTNTETFKVGQLIRPSLDIRDRFGNAATVDGIPVWSQPTDPSHGVVELAVDGLSAVVRARGVGQGQVSVTADADLGEGVRQVTGILSYTILGAEATVIGFNVGAAEEDPSA